jgi:hypothetical protein
MNEDTIKGIRQAIEIAKKTIDSDAVERFCDHIGVTQIFFKSETIDKIVSALGVKLRGDETFTELLEIEKQVKEYNERKERIAEEKANIQRVDAQTKKHWRR